MQQNKFNKQAVRVDYLIFISICVIANISPGPAVFMAIRNGSDYGLRTAVVGISGNLLAMVTLAIISAAGIGSIILASHSLYATIKILGGIYLVYLGINACRATIGKCSAGSAPKVMSPLQIFRESFTIGISNPKSIAFYTALFPQFINTSQPIAEQFLTLSGICSLISCSFLFFYAATAAKLASHLRQDNVRTWFNRFTGTAFIGFGVALMAN